MISRLKSPIAAAVASATVTAVVVGGIAVAQSAPTPPVAACVQDQTGSVRIVQGSTDCKANESFTTWNREGQAGPQGLQGPAGPQGPQGAAGAPGSTASFFHTAPAPTVYDPLATIPMPVVGDVVVRCYPSNFSLYFPNGGYRARRVSDANGDAHLRAASGTLGSFTVDVHRFNSSVMGTPWSVDVVTADRVVRIDGYGWQDANGCNTFYEITQS